MKRALGILSAVVVLVLLGGSAFVLTGEVPRVTRRAPAESSDLDDFLEEGRSYVFNRSGQFVGKVLSDSSGKWLKVEVQFPLGGGTPYTSLINLDLVSSIEPYNLTNTPGRPESHR